MFYDDKKNIQKKINKSENSVEKIGLEITKLFRFWSHAKGKKISEISR